MFGLNTSAMFHLISNMRAAGEKSFSANLSAMIIFLAHMKRKRKFPNDCSPFPELTLLFKKKDL